MAAQRGRIVLLVLAGITVLSLWRAGSVEREKRRINEAYKQAQQLLSQVEEERVVLSKTIEGQATDLQGLQDEMTRVQEKLDQTVVELASLQREHEQLRQHDASLNAQLSSVLAEKQQLETKLSDIKQLRLAIHDVKRKMWSERWARWRAQIQALKEEDQRRLAAGNRGYVVRDGQPTLGSGRKFHVHVLEPEAAP